jgi:hypothetical protein
MGIQIIGAGGSIAEVGAFAQKGLHVLPKPIDVGALGHYRVASVSGTMAAALAASAQVYQFKWTDATRLAVILRLAVKFITLTRFTAGTVTDQGLDAFVVRTYAAGGGGTALTLTGDNAALRASFGTTLVSEIRVPTTTALTAATTLDTQPFAQSFGLYSQVTPSATIAQEDWNFGGDDSILEYKPRLGDGEYPLTLATNEGIVVRNRAVWPAAGTGIFSFLIHWAEVTAF